VKYYANILTPFSALVEKKIEEVKGLDVPVDMIAMALEKAGFELMDDGIKSLWAPDEKALKECFEFGKAIG